MPRHLHLLEEEPEVRRKDCPKVVKQTSDGTSVVCGLFELKAKDTLQALEKLLSSPPPQLSIIEEFKLGAKPRPKSRS